jgi:ABC-2 type transport system ATP-binding protein
VANAISVEHVSKKYRLYDERNQSLKSVVMRKGRRAKYEEFQALDDVSVEIGTGETFGFIGENGSGKSTLLKCIAQILRPESGTINVEGKMSALLELGAGFHPELSGRENVYLNGAILGLSKKDIDARFDDIVEFAGLGRFIDSAVKNYSSGMYVKLGFSVAINVDPDVLLVDEVLAVGDEAFQRKCSEKFTELRESGKTIVVVSHGLAMVRAMCDRAMWLEHGEVKGIGRASDVIDAYLGTVHTAHVVEDERRWGTGEAKIEVVELLDGHGNAIERTKTGERVTIRIRYKVEEPVKRPVFRFVIYTSDGQVVTAPTTKELGPAFDVLDGSGTVEFVVDRLLLLPGLYDISAAISDQTMLHEFDNRHRTVRFEVDAGTPHETYGGVTSLGGEFRHHAEPS